MNVKQIGGLFLGVLFIFGAFLVASPLNDQGGWSEAAPTATTKMMYYTLVSEGGGSPHTAYTATAQDRTTDAGEDVDGIEITYLLDKAFASTSSDALDNTRFYVTIKDPSDNVIIQEYVYADLVTAEHDYEYAQANDGGDSWACFISIEFEDVDHPITLTTGEWDVIVRYDIFS